MRAWLERVVTWALDVFEPLIVRLGQVGFIQAGVVLAAQTFMALFPLLIAIVAIGPAGYGKTVASTLRDHLGLSGETNDTVTQLVNTRSQLGGGITAFGVILVLVSATSFTRALQRVYENAWQLPKMGIKGSLRGLLWLIGLVFYLGVLGVAVRLASGNGAPISLLRWTLSTLGAMVLWWWTPFLLLGGRVRGRALILGSVLTGVAMVILGAVSKVYLPRAIKSQERQFGTIGTVFAIESWLVVLACTIVAVAVVGAVAAQYPGRFGQLVRGSAEPEGWRRDRGGRHEPTRGGLMAGLKTGNAPDPAARTGPGAGSDPPHPD